MSESNPDESQRNYWPPPVWSTTPKSVVPPVHETPITRRVNLPETVSVGYLAEITGQELRAVIDELVHLRLFLGVNRSLDFDDAAKLLRKYGIGADKAV